VAITTFNSEGFCSCNNPTAAKDNKGTKYCRRCNKDIEDTTPVIDFDSKVRSENLVSLQEARDLDQHWPHADPVPPKFSPAVYEDDASGLGPDIDCPFCYGHTGWSYSTGKNGNIEDEAYCGDCDIVYTIATGEFVSGSGDPKTIKAKHNQPAKGSAEDKSVQIIKNGKGPDKPAEPDKPIEKHYCRADKDSKGTFVIICDYCPKTFEKWKDAFDHETVDSDGKPKGTGYSYGGGGFSSCSHHPTHVINGGEEGWNIYAGNKWGCSGKLKDYDIVLNLTGDSVYRQGHSIPIPALSKFQGGQSQKNLKPIEIVLDWPDMGVLDLGRDWWDAFAAHVKKSKSKVVMFCMGGHGRTGTALASLLVTFLGWGAKESIDWVHENYCEKAIETVSQMTYVYKMAGEKPPSDLKARKGKGTGNVQTVTTVGGNDDKGHTGGNGSTKLI